MAEKTLEAMCCGGIHDHLGGGFHRYSTDKEWRVPHFEKMLYDQALLLMAFTEAWLATKKPLYRNDRRRQLSRTLPATCCRRKVHSFQRRMRTVPAGKGRFISGHEKNWMTILGPRDGPFAARFFGVEEAGNFFSPECGPGKNILYLKTGNPGKPADPARIDRDPGETPGRTAEASAPAAGREDPHRLEWADDRSTCTVVPRFW